MRKVEAILLDGNQDYADGEYVAIRIPVERGTYPRRIICKNLNKIARYGENCAVVTWRHDEVKKMIILVKQIDFLLTKAKHNIALNLQSVVPVLESLNKTMQNFAIDLHACWSKAIDNGIISPDKAFINPFEEPEEILPPYGVKDGNEA